MTNEELLQKIEELEGRIRALEEVNECPHCTNPAEDEQPCSGDWQETGRTCRCCDDCRYNCAMSV